MFQNMCAACKLYALFRLWLSPIGLCSNANMAHILWALAMYVLCWPLQALHGVCSKYNVKWLREMGFVKAANLCCCCLAAIVTVPGTQF